ncbi:MAG: hypothetical protein EA414_18695 [Arthrospira sp. PLM2.Bin9]|nr:trypsin-like serine protease [Arthrospira sp. PLM2.Bin9]TVU52236.1 MAG: hypothetical protein EA414_18695 [Arthrospira sp. PLM2.Bin9]
MAELLALSFLLDPDHPAYQVRPGQGYDGVVRLTINGTRTCTGALLTSGRHILTAAQCFETQTPGPPTLQPNPNSVQITFELPRGLVGRTAAAIHVHPQWDNSIHHNANLAIIELAQAAPAEADRYPIYRGQDELSEINQVFTRVGYGLPGDGASGADPNGSHQRRIGGNRYDAFGDLLERPPQGFQADATLGNITAQTQLLYDFDAFTRTRDALGQEYGLHDLGVLRQIIGFSAAERGVPPLIERELPPNPQRFEAIPISPQPRSANPAHPFIIPWESGATKGDEGSPAFIDGRIAGITSHGVAPRTPGINMSEGINGSVGEYFLDTRVSAYADFIDQILQQTSPIPDQSGMIFGLIIGTVALLRIFQRFNQRL